jgi:hypothetical protein
VHGSGFTADSAITWGPLALGTHFAGSTELSAQISAAEIANAGSTGISVKTPFPGGDTSNTFQFQVDSASSAAPPEFSPSTATVSAGGAAAYGVTIPPSASSVSVACLNLPTGSTCSYSASSRTLTITTSSTSPKGNYQITVVFTETLPDSIAYESVFPIFLLPLIFARQKFTLQNRRARVGWGLVLLVVIAMNTGCGKNGSSAGLTSPSVPTHQVTCSGLVNLIIE